jgi:hypothetical protein
MLAAPLRGSIAAEPPEQRTPNRTISISVDAAALGDQGVGIDKIVVDRLRPHFESGGYQIVERDAALAFRLRFDPLREDRFDYGLRFEFVTEAEVESAIEWVPCITCTDAKLLEILDKKAPELLEATNERFAATETSTTSEESTSDEGDSRTTPDEASTGEDTGEDGEPVEVPAPIGPLGIGGAIGLAAGLGLSIAGGVEFRHQTEELDLAKEVSGRADHRPTGRALLGAGIGVAVVGVALLATDLALRAKKRKTNSVTITPTLSPEYAGIGIGGRF